jgi:hypothetical protein
MKRPSVDEVFTICDGMKGAAIGRAELYLFKHYDLNNLIPVLAEAYTKFRRAEVRSVLLFWLLRYARRYDAVVQLARSSLYDRAYLVREYACSILAYSLRDDVVADLETLLSHRDPRTRENAVAAVDAIRSKNHHFYVDRNHTGYSYWVVNPDEAPWRNETK